MQKPELKELPNPQYILYIARCSGAANNLVLREVDTLKIAQVVLCHIMGAQESPGVARLTACFSGREKRKQLILNSKLQKEKQKSMMKL